MNLFFDLLQMALGVRESLSRLPADRPEWDELQKTCAKHNLLGFTFPVIDRLHDDDVVPLGIYTRWAMAVEKIQEKNSSHIDACRQLYSWFKKQGLRSCVLKGQAAGSRYPRPELRQCGDIDIWVEGGEKMLVPFLRSKELKVNRVFYHHCDAHFFKGINVELHFMPSWMNAPHSDRRLQEYFASRADEQLSNYDEKLGFCIPTVDFDAVFMLIHIYRHVLDEGIGLRQLLDYYYVLKALPTDERERAWKDIRALKLTGFAAGVMYVLEEVFAMPHDLALCEPDPGQGRFLIDEIMVSGNFGKYDDRNAHEKHEKRIFHARRKIGRSMRYLKYYPSEVLGIPVFMIRHYYWRVSKGYLEKV